MRSILIPVTILYWAMVLGVIPVFVFEIKHKEVSLMADYFFAFTLVNLIKIFFEQLV